MRHSRKRCKNKGGIPKQGLMILGSEGKLLSDPKSND